MVSDQEINQRIAEEQAKIKVPSYGDVTLDGAWKRRSSMMWGLSIIGAAFGACFGLAAPIFAAIGGATVTTQLVLNSVAIFAATGMSTGLATGVVVGSPAGAAASAAKEMERRILARDIEEKIRANPEADVELQTRETPPTKEPFRLANFLNVKTAIAFTVIGAIGGLIAAAAFIASGGLTGAGPAAAYAMPAMTTLLGTATPTISMVTSYSVGMGMAFGAFFGVNVPRIALHASNALGDLLSGKAIDAKWPESANSPALKPVLSPVIVTYDEPEMAGAKSFADKVERKPNFEQLVVQSIQEADAQITR